MLCDKRMAYAAVGGSLYAGYAIRLPDRKGSIQKRASRLCRVPDCHAASAWPILRSEEAYTLNLRLDSSAERIAYKSEHPGFAGCPIAIRQAHSLCYGRKGLDAEPAIRFPSRKDQHTKSGTLTLQDARLPCGKRMAYAAVEGGLDAEPAIRLSRSEGSRQWTYDKAPQSEGV